MSDPTPSGDESRPPLNLALVLALVVLALAGNGLLLFWPRPTVEVKVTDAGKSVDNRLVTVPPAQPAQPAQQPVQPTQPTPPPAQPAGPRSGN